MSTKARDAADRLREQSLRDGGGGERSSSLNSYNVMMNARLSVDNFVPLAADNFHRAENLARRRSLMHSKRRVDVAANAPLDMMRKMLTELGVTPTADVKRRLPSRLLMFAGNASFASGPQGRGRRASNAKQVIAAMQRRYPTIVVDEYYVSLFVCLCFVVVIFEFT